MMFVLPGSVQHEKLGKRLLRVCDVRTSNVDTVVLPHPMDPIMAYRDLDLNAVLIGSTWVGVGFLKSVFNGLLKFRSLLS
jgi:hypothetical protein